MSDTHSPIWAKSSEKSGETAQQMGEEAAAHFRAVIKHDPNDAFAHAFLGYALEQLGRYEEAARSFGRALELAPGNVEMTYRYAQTLLRAGKRKEGQAVLVAFENLRKAKGEGGAAEKSLDISYARRGKYSEGIIETSIPPFQSRSLKGLGFEDSTSTQLAQQKPPPLNFKHQGTAMDPEVAKAWRGEPMPKEWFAKNKEKFVAAFGSGVAVGDYDSDGHPDVYLVNAGGTNALFRNNGNGTFTNVTAKAGVGGNGKPGMAAVWGDYDNDGFPDLLVTTYGGVILYHNNRNGTFTDVTKSAGLGNLPPDAWCMGAAFVDIDHEGDLDIYVCRYADLTRLPDKPTLRFPDDFQGQPNLLFRNNWADTKTSAPGYQAPTPFTETAASAKVDGGRRKSLGVIFSDFNNDNAVDFLLVNDGDPNAVFINNRDRTFREEIVAHDADSVAGKGRAGGVAVTDVNYDGNVDAFVANGAGGEPAVLLGAGDGKFNALKDAVVGLTKNGERITGVGFFDFDNDGFPDLFIARSSLPGQPPAHPVLLHNEGGRFRDVSQEVTVRVSDQRHVKLSDYAMKAARGLAVGDFNNDGRADVVIVNNGDQPTLLLAALDATLSAEQPAEETRRAGNFVKVRAVGYCPSKDGVQSNLGGVGAKVEVRAPGLWYRQEVMAGGGYLSCHNAELLFGIGERLRVDFVRAIFPSGIRAAQITLANNRIALNEPMGEPPSCPYLYFWNGERFEFLCDVLAAGTIGELVSPTAYLNLPPFEPVKVDGAKLQPKDGAYRFSLVNQLPEVDYIEQARLVAVDHPADVEVYPDNRLTGRPRPPVLRIFAVRDIRLPRAATDDAGRDVLSLIARKDRRYHTDVQPLRWRGFARRHTLTLDLGDLTPQPKTQNLKPVLLLYGYVTWGGSSTALGAGQAGVFYEMPQLEVRDASGRWKVVDPDMGIPAGHPRTIVVPLALERWNVGTLERWNVRIRTNMTVYWDEVRVGFAESFDVPTLQPANLPTLIHEAPLQNADLHRLGYPQPTSPDGRKPYLYDYHRCDDFKDMPSLVGAFTRYGDVTPLLTERDDMFVIMNHGDAVQMSFDANALPPPPRGWKRDFVLLLWGYGKSTDVNTAHSLTVEPLPFAAMSRYPYPPSESYPMDAKHLRYLAEYNTR
ncbi:MAG: FG-GAP-like repeat-containing protein [Abditibacteriales bacterium]|nr:FG-GAP-like repeat-containing protein [Abditibacteriales bacterium]